MANGDRWKERVKGIHTIISHDDDDDTVEAQIAAIQFIEFKYMQALLKKKKNGLFPFI